MWFGNTNQASLPQTMDVINFGEVDKKAISMIFFYMQTKGHHQRVFTQRKKDPGLILQLIRG